MIDPSIWLNLDLVAPKMALTSENGAALEHVLFAAVDSLAKNAKQPRNVTIRVRKLDHKALVLIAHDGAQTGSVSSAGHYAPLVRLAIAELMPVQFRHFGKLEVIAITANLSAAKRPKAGHRGKFNKETDNEDQ